MAPTAGTGGLNPYDCSVQFAEQGVSVDVRCRDLLREAARGLEYALNNADPDNMETIVLAVGAVLAGVAVIGGELVLVG